MSRGVGAVVAAVAILLPACRAGNDHARRAAPDTLAARGAVDSGVSDASRQPAERPRDTVAARTGSPPSGRPARPDTVPSGAARTATRAEPRVTEAAPAAPGVRMPAAPGTTPPAARMVPAYVVFRDTVRASDVDWLRSEGFEIVRVNESSHSVSARMPAGYHGKPTSNPRVLRFSVAMR